MKIDRLLAITVLLLGRKRVTAAELAERFEVTMKTIYRDMETLGMAGLPIVSHQGAAGGYEIMEQFTLDRQLVTGREIASLLAALKGMHYALDDRTFASLEEKIRALLTKTDEQDGDKHSAELVFDFHPWGQGPLNRDKVILFRKAIRERRRVRLRYLDGSGEESFRSVEPYTLIMKGSSWYVQAYCTLREDYRLFRLSRVMEPVLEQQTFIMRNPPELETIGWKREWSGHTEIEVILCYRPEALHRVLDIFRPDQIRYEADGSCRVQACLPVDDWFHSMLLSFGAQVKVLHPPSLAEEIRQQAILMLQQYE
ncbi:DNA-binding transcriptional regulator [Paenibacillus sambharensis]|uniref:DNA-binding transcriptional regulator n=1 Tax=Paenibacillus sambharensis TaxID=1803190 RepID=A0A2W1L4I0_9BACL|nr:YafY family protein [Paenibacillus sambharensis]PZD93090.1 DNA-binding transcriptional regulator [Paenibacillus sambharensis]